MYTTQKQVRSAFWDMCEEFQPAFKRVKGCTQNDYPADIRARFVDFVDFEMAEGNMSESLAQRVTL